MSQEFRVFSVSYNDQEADCAHRARDCGMTLLLPQVQDVLSAGRPVTAPDTSSVEVLKSRCEGLPTDFAHGKISLEIESPAGPLRIVGAWSAFAQPLPEQGWYFELQIDSPLAGIQSPVPILDEHGELATLRPDSEQLRLEAEGFWSYISFDELVASKLPTRAPRVQP